MTAYCWWDLFKSPSYFSPLLSLPKSRILSVLSRVWTAMSLQKLRIGLVNNGHHQLKITPWRELAYGRRIRNILRGHVRKKVTITWGTRFHWTERRKLAPKLMIRTDSTLEVFQSGRWAAIVGGSDVIDGPSWSLFKLSIVKVLITWPAQSVGAQWL